MKKTTGLLLILVCATLLPAPAQETTDGGAASTIRALERTWLEAQARNDNRTLDQMFDNGLVYVEYGRLLSKSDYLSRIRMEKPHPQQILMDPMTVRTFGSTAIVVGTYRERSTKDGKSLVERWPFVDTWVYKKGAWVLVAAAAAPLRQ